MQFDTTTFILEIINFLVLIWILQRLFYKPVLALISKRQSEIAETLDNTQNLRREAETLRERYENREKLWEQEKLTLQNQFQQQLDTERSQQLVKLQSELDELRRKAELALERQQAALQRETEKQALRNSAKFAQLILQQAAGPELEARLLELLLNQLEHTAPDVCGLCLQLVESKKQVTISVASAFGLSPEQQARLEAQFRQMINTPLLFKYQQDQTLISGLRIDIGAWVLQANLQHELTGFAELADGAY